MKNIVHGISRAALALAACIALGGTAFAQQKKGDMSIGANLLMGTNSGYTNFGIGAKAQYNISTPVRVEASWNYFFKKSLGDVNIGDFNMSTKVSTWDLNLNLHYLFPVADWVAVYPLVGVGLFHGSISSGASLGDYGLGGSDGCTELAGNLGAGAEYYLAANMFVNLEAKWQIIHAWANRFVLSAGIVYVF
ncbi:MAG: porin family protein [Tannerella sp.]|jgi:outer membrane protein X|nr:porin family protein [Tannerella sp.]